MTITLRSARELTAQDLDALAGLGYPPPDALTDEALRKRTEISQLLQRLVPAVADDRACATAEVYPGVPDVCRLFGLQPSSARDLLARAGVKSSARIGISKSGHRVALSHRRKSAG